MAFVLPTGAVGASSLHGARVATPAVCANAGIAMRAGGDAPTRRAVLAGALAAAGLAILPDTAQAMGGEGAKQSFFGAKSISNPFTYNEKSKGPIVYKVRLVFFLRGEQHARASAMSRHRSSSCYCVVPVLKAVLLGCQARY